MTYNEIIDRCRDVINGVPQVEWRKIMSRIESTNITEIKDIIGELNYRKDKLPPGDSMIPIIEKAIEEYRAMANKTIDNIIAYSMMHNN